MHEAGDVTLPSGTSGDSLAVHKHVVHGDWQSRVMAMHYHGYTVAHEEDVYACCVNLA